MPIYGEIISRNRVKPEPRKLHTLSKLPSHNNKKNCNHFRYNKLLEKILTINYRGV